jgi:uncharacterized membrane protein YbhN (UPF0104 family)
LDEPQDRATPPARRWLSWAVRIGVAAGALAWTFHIAPVGEVTEALTALAPLALVGALGVFVVLMVLGAVRWGVLLAAFGAQRRPPLPQLNRLFLVGHFYNTFLPANVGGDVLRGHLTRWAFGSGAGGYVIVLVERVFGMVALLLVCNAAILIRPVAGVSGLGILAVISIFVAVLIVSVLMLGQRASPWLPGPLGRFVASLPAPARPGMMLAALVLSAAIQMLVAVCGHLLLRDLVPSMALADSLVLVPLAMLAMYFPATIAGLGVREAAFVVLLGPVGVAPPTAAAVSLAMLGIQAVVALGGGLLLLGPLGVEPDQD